MKYYLYISLLIVYFYNYELLLIRRPFARRLSEFKFWHSCARATIIAIVMTFFDVFDVPVFWPILLLYFIVLFFITMKRQILHMIKFRYVPWNWGKQKYQGKWSYTVCALKYDYLEDFFDTASVRVFARFSCGVGARRKRQCNVCILLLLLLFHFLQIRIVNVV